MFFFRNLLTKLTIALQFPYKLIYRNKLVSSTSSLYLFFSDLTNKNVLFLSREILITEISSSSEISPYQSYSYISRPMKILSCDTLCQVETFVASFLLRSWMNECWLSVSAMSPSLFVFFSVGTTQLLLWMTEHEGPLVRSFGGIRGSLQRKVARSGA